MSSGHVNRACNKSHHLVLKLVSAKVIRLIVLPSAIGLPFPSRQRPQLTICHPAFYADSMLETLSFATLIFRFLHRTKKKRRAHALDS